MPAAADRISPAYRAVMALSAPVVRRWGRLTVVGAEALPRKGPLLLIANHDSHWDPLVIGVAARGHRQIHALAKESLWRVKPVGWVLTGMGQIPIKRDASDTGALAIAVDRLRGGACIGVFPEGTISQGRPLRARSGAGRLAVAVPDATVVAARVTGAVDIVRFPVRPRIRVEFFQPTGGGPAAGESAADVTVRVMNEIRVGAPYVRAGRGRKRRG